MINETTITAPAKINLWLEIRARRSDGYHDIESVMQSVSLCDTLNLVRADTIEITCSDATLDCGEENLCHRAARLFFSSLGIHGGVKIHIEKRIPIAGGLAGGSTDAAATLCGLNQIYDTDLSIDQLCEMGVKIGADVPFCLRQGIFIARGIGDRFSLCAPLPKCHILIAKTGEGVSTPWAYGKLDDMYDFSNREVDVEAFSALLRARDLEKIANGMTNIFESAILPVRPEVVKLKEIMRSGGALCALMSGSGPTVFGIFDNVDNAEATKRHLEERGIAAHICEPLYPNQN